MFMKTMAVGPLEEVESCITGGMTLAIDRLAVTFWYGFTRLIQVDVVLGKEEDETCLDRCDTEDFEAMLTGVDQR